MASIAQLQDRLLKNGSVQPSDNLDSDVIVEWLEDAIALHNSSYQSDASDLPDREVQLVVLLAHISLCHFRANKWTEQNDLSGAQGYGQERGTPFHKNIKLADSLYAQYKAKCVQLGITPNPDIESNTLTQGAIVVSDSQTATRLPYRSDPTKIATPKLTITEVTSSSFVVSWPKSRDPLFTDYILFFHEGEHELYQAWNDNSSVFAKVKDTAEKLLTITSPDSTARKLVGLNASSKYSLLLVVANANRKYAYSATTVVTTSA